MYATGGRRAPRQRSRTWSDPARPYVTPPYTIQWPAPARRATEPTGMTPGSYPHPRSPPAGEAHPRLLAPYPSPPTPISPGSSQRSGHRRSSSRQGTIRTPQEPSGPLIKDAPPLSRTALNVFSAATPAPLPHLASWDYARRQGSLLPPKPPTPMAGMQRQGSYLTAHQLPPASVYHLATAAHLSHHSAAHHPPNAPHHLAHHRSRPRPPSAASHRYASSITPPMYGHGSSAASWDASHTSLNGGASSQRGHHHATSLPDTPASHHDPGTRLTRVPSASPHRLHSHAHVPPPSTPETTATAHWSHKLKGTPHNPSSPPLAADELRRSTQRPALPENYDGEVQTRYVSMLLALDGISPLFNILASFFTWILLAGFLLFPGTFASLSDSPAGSPQSDILGVVNHISLYIIAWVCTGIGASGMIWLWWKWQNNYIWITNRIFVPGCLNSLAGVISTLTNVYGVQGGVFGRTEMSTIIVTGVLSVVCGMLVLVYEFWLTRNLRLEHDRLVGVEKVGKHGEGVLGEKRRGRSREM